MRRAHRAAYPEKFPLGGDVKEVYPLLENVKDKMRPTAVHIQIYDGRCYSPMRSGCDIHLARTADAAHILPLLFPFSTPGKFCIRAMAAFTRQVTNAPSQSRLVIPITPAISTSSTSSPASLDSSALVFVAPRSSTLSSKPAGAEGENVRERSRSESKRQVIAFISHAAVKVKGRSAQIFRFGKISVGRNSRSGSPNGEPSSIDHEEEYIYAGDRVVYNTWVCYPISRLFLSAKVCSGGVQESHSHDQGASFDAGHHSNSRARR